MKTWLKLGVPALLLAVLVAAIVLIPPGGNGGPPPIDYGHATCAQCRMIVSQPGFGAQVRRGAEWHVYDDLGCLQRALEKAPADPADVWVEDRNGGGFVPAAGASFVRGPRDGTPMGSGLAAFAKKSDAEAFAAEKRAGKVLAFADLSAPAGDEPPFTELEATLGKALFVSECGACHGEKGDGKGVASAWLDPKPRDFTKKMFKLRTTESGKPPRPEDVLATLEAGMPGSSMPSYAFLSKEDKRKVGAYVFKVAGLLDKPVADAVPDPGEPPAPDAALLARGQELWTQMGCGACHGAGGRGDGANAAQLKDSWGHPIRPRDLTTDPLRGGDEPRDIWYRVFAGIDGTPMPPFGDMVTDPRDRWALVAHVSSLRKPVPAAIPAEPLLAGRAIAERAGCRGCHVLDDGKGGDIGPSFGLIAQKLQPEWIESFLDDPRAPGKIYPWRAHRMPDVALTRDEGRAMAQYFATLSKKSEIAAAPDPATFPADRLAEGKMTFVVTCAQCHALGDTIKTPLASQQGPDLVHAPERVRWDFSKEWILDPKKFDPKTRMVIPPVNAAQADSVRMFIWKIASDENAARKHAAIEPPK